jgi:hypothetical protein
MSPIPDLTAAELAGRMSTAAVADMLEWGPGTTAEQQFALVLGVQIPLARILEFNDIDVQALDDDRPVNEYYLLRAWLPSRWSKAIYARAARR